MFLQILAVIVVVLAGFAYWRWIAAKQRTNERDEVLLARLESVGKRLDAGESVSHAEIEELAAKPENRYVLYPALRQMGRDQLLPLKYDTTIAQGEAALAFWLMHPDQLKAAPEKIELVETVMSEVAGSHAEFHVYRYRMPAGHPAADQGWILGVTGPMDPDAVPYTKLLAAFSRTTDLDGKIAPWQVVDAYVSAMKQKGPAK
jgi:hypothetical protein